jgi:hypothetical protein
MDDFIRFVQINKEQIVAELYNWARTFEFELDEEDEPTRVPFATVRNLAKRLEKNLCTLEDYKKIEFHIYQINYDEIIIEMGIPSGWMPN